MPSTCKAWVLSGPRSMRFQDVPVPDHLEDGQALGRIEASGICGTDWEQYVGRLDETGILEYPCIIGHEPLLRVERLTPAARRKWNLEEGDRVLAYALGCNVCRYCLRGQHVLCDSPELIRRGFTSAERGLWGSLAEYMLISDSVIYKIPESVSAEDALLYNPLSAGFEWAVERGGVGMGDDVLILGAGQRGLASVVACVEARASRIIVSGLPADEEKLKLARRLGATDTVIVDPADPNSLTDQIGAEVVDVAVEVVPLATRPVVDAIQAVRRGGTVVIGGIKGMQPIPEFVSDRLIFKSLDVRGVLGYGALSQKRAIDTILSGRYDFSDWHTHTLPLDDAEDAIRILGGEIQTGRTPIHVSVMGSQPRS